MEATASDDKREEHGSVVVFNVRLAKLLGLYQMLDPGSPRLAGYHAYHVLVVVIVTYVTVVSTAVFVSGLRSFASDGFTNQGIQSMIATEIYMFSCYKLLMVTRRSRQFRDCLQVTRSDFTACGRRDRGAGLPSSLARSWRDRSVRSTDAYAVACFVTTLFYVTGPMSFRDHPMDTTNPDGSPGRYRVNVLNLYALASADTYNAHFGLMYVIESACVWIFCYMFLVFDTLLITLCVALSYHLNVVNVAFLSLWSRARRPRSLLRDARDPTTTNAAITDNIFDFDTAELQKTSDNEHFMMYDDLKSLLKDHQAVIKYVDMVFSLFQMILPHILVTSTVIIGGWFLVTKDFVNGKMQADSPTLQMTFACPILSFQIFLTCYLFDILHSQKEAIIFALYSSNWTEMDIKCKKLILLAMNMNNAHKRKLKYTPTRIVNLDLFLRTMRVCYSVVSMMLNYRPS